jgi:hypothetical protein
MAYTRKTFDTWELHGDYNVGHGLELLCAATTSKEIKDDKKAYKENDPNVRNLTIKKKREKIK